MFLCAGVTPKVISGTGARQAAERRAKTARPQQITRLTQDKDWLTWVRKANS